MSSTHQIEQPLISTSCLSPFESISPAIIKREEEKNHFINLGINARLQVKFTVTEGVCLTGLSPSRTNYYTLHTLVPQVNLLNEDMALGAVQVLGSREDHSGYPEAS